MHCPEEDHLARVWKTAGFSGVLFTAVWAVHAQPNATSETQPETGRAVADGGVTEPGQLRASKLLGRAIYNSRDIKIGAIKELVLDKDGKVAAVIVDVAFVGFGDKYVAVNLSDIRTNNNHLALDRTSDQLQQMTSYKLESEDSGTGTSSLNPGSHLMTGPTH